MEDVFVYGVENWFGFGEGVFSIIVDEGECVCFGVVNIVGYWCIQEWNVLGFGFFGDIMGCFWGDGGRVDYQGVFW